MDARRAAVLGTIGVERFVSRLPAGAAQAPVTADELGGLGWDALQGLVSACTRCGLAATRTQTVFGVGDRSARWLVVGEAPGADEDREGEPFVGAAGQLLNSMLRASGVQREQVYIANVLKCRPPGNRDPSPEEISCCLPYLRRQIQLIGPRLVLCVGRIAAHSVLGVDTPIGALRGRVHRLADADVPVVVTYHPSYLLRAPTEKLKAWQDLKIAMGVALGHGA